jgi:hypothetical protein
MTELDHLRLMQHYDAELTPEEAELFEAHLREAGLDARARSVEAGLDQLGDIVRALAGAEEQAAAAVADKIADQVLSQLSATDQADSRAAQRETVTRRGSPLWAWSAGVGGITALAAAVLLFVWSGIESRDPGSASGVGVAATGPIASYAPEEVAPTQSALAARIDLEPGVAIEMVDFGARSGTIFMVPSGEDAPTPVVWLVDEGPDVRGRVEQL